jgi:hypothetical protein
MSGFIQSLSNVSRKGKDSDLLGIKYDKQDQQGKAAFNERNPHMTQQQEPVARSPGGPQTKTGQGKDNICNIFIFNISFHVIVAQARKCWEIWRHETLIWLSCYNPDCRIS